MRVTARGLAEKEEKLRAMAARLRDLSPVMRVIGERFVAETLQSFREQASPDGTPWPALSGVTVYRRITRGQERLSGGQFGPRQQTQRRSRAFRRSGALTRRAERMLSPGGIQMLRDKGALAQGISSKAMPKSVRLSADRVYAATQQFGRAENKMFNNAKGHPAPIPARPFMPVVSVGGKVVEMSGGRATAFWAYARRALREYVLTGEILAE